ncbi:uncharacterized protein KY384_001070 [Bacidia gigantensis]|uniref:uncharacterized protein n=1 Tax=Bacidia gigantensis TaxID=2732470 RepID=UPI001D0434B7|nr:uncharacterized protein KY384_001070 [Bacidia gigantensis]KAG8534226.1 hypothetical protein KY384_001070 [Bacidia gigantensis]
MSLRVDGHSRGRSRSPGRKDERSRSRDARAPSPAVQVVIKSDSHKKKDDSDSDDKRKKKHSKKHKSSDSESDTKSKHKKSSKKRYEDSSSSSSSESDSRSKKHSSRRRRSESESDHKSRRKTSKKYYDESSSSDSESSSSSSEEDRKHKHSSSKKEHHKSGKSSKSHHEHDRRPSHSHEKQYTRDTKGEKVLVMPGAFAPAQQYVVAQPASHQGRGPQYAQVEPYQYANAERKLSYSAQPQVVEAKPHRRTSSPPSMRHLSISSGSHGHSGLAAPGSHRGSMSGGLPPGSPLLEAYRGTYQSISPMPSPLMLASKDDSDLSDLSPLDGDDSDSDDSLAPRLKPKKKKVSFYDPEPDAIALASALKHSTIDAKPLIKILPHLSDDHVLMLRTEYKKHMKAQGKGVNIAKHIKMKVTGNLGKAAYAVALGRWESEAHWANFWYQSNSSRRELLIESLMGRTNSEIVKIKEAFSDQRYHNSLEKCMQTELKKDKFRTAVLLVLEEKRMSESEKVEMSHVRKDTDTLYKCLAAKEGGETAMINIIVLRSDKHLAEVMRVFEAMYKKNFAREMIKRSQNLVGETLAHILNGVLNRPVRDALLLHQALAETSKDRADLLVSRLVRYHWEPKHLARVKVAYKQKYGSRLEKDVSNETKGDFSEFLQELCRAEE